MHCINVLPLRLRLEDDGESFLALVKRVGAQLKEAAANGDVSYQQILDAVCSGARSTAHAPLAQATLTDNMESKCGKRLQQ